MKILIGSVHDLEDTPKIIKISKRPYILDKVKDEIKLFSADCPHMHGIVSEVNQNEYKCPSHKWTFEPNSGRCVNAPTESLKSYDLIIEGDNIFAEIELGDIKEIFLKKEGDKISPKITLVSNACMLIQWDGFNILTDPWIEGNSLFGAWVPYPPSDIKIKDLPKIDAIWITHEHSDHLHPHSLSFFDKNIPIYVPHFNTGRLSKILKKIGFKNITSVKPVQPCTLSKDIEITSIEQYSDSLYNDSIMFLQLGNFKMLNLNDAGFNWKLIEMIGDVDLISSTFTYGASPYPLNYTDIDNETKRSFMIEKNEGMLKQIKQILELCPSKYFIPMAHFAELTSSEYDDVIELQIKNSPKDVKEYFKDSDECEIIDLIPGDIWNGEKNKIIRKNRKEDVFDRKILHKYLEKECYAKKANSYPKKFDIDESEIKKYFMSFSNSKLAKGIGEYTMQISMFGEQRKLNAVLNFSKGQVTYVSGIEHPRPDIYMSCPGSIVQEIIQNNLNWDEILYWSKIHRNNLEHNSHLWKLLHAPWIAQIDNSELFLKNSQSISKMAIATILEMGGKKAVKIMEKYGLFCLTCDASIGENIVEGCKIHGVDQQKTELLIKELEEILKK
jgi:CMP-N-acetylneuraminate monooxygenase